MSEIILLVAVARNRAIGIDNRLPWHLPEDLQRFKALTTGHAVLMGRKTWESLPPKFRPLPGRRNLVVTRQAGYAAPGAEVASSIEAALQLAGDAEKIYVIGGADIYGQMLDIADTLEITEVDLEPAGDAFFPEIDRAAWRETFRDARTAADATGFAFVTLRRAR